MNDDTVTSFLAWHASELAIIPLQLCTFSVDKRIKGWMRGPTVHWVRFPTPIRYVPEVHWLTFDMDELRHNYEYAKLHNTPFVLIPPEKPFRPEILYTGVSVVQRLLVSQ